MVFKKYSFLVWIFAFSYHFLIFSSDLTAVNSDPEQAWESLKKEFNDDLNKKISDFSHEEKDLLHDYFTQLATRRCASNNYSEGTYYGITAASIVMTIGAAMNLPFANIMQLLTTSYFTNQISFLLTHLRFHADFIGQPLNNMKHNSLFALFHHYYDASVFKKYWQAYRALYFFETDELGAPRLGVWGNSVSWQHIAVGTTYFSFLDFNTATMLTGLHLLWWNLQAVTHEWYHVPVDKEKRQHFNAITYRIFNALEYLNLIDTKKHKEHHKHHLNNLAEATDFFDMNAFFLNNLDDAAFEFYKWLATTQGPDGDKLDESKLVNIATKIESIGIPVTLALNIFVAWAMQTYS